MTWEALFKAFVVLVLAGPVVVSVTGSVLAVRWLLTDAHDDIRQWRQRRRTQSDMRIDDSLWQIDGPRR